MCVQIFQIDLPLILSTFKYFPHILELSLSFYGHPNTPDFHVGKSSENICTLEELKQLCAIFKDFLMKIRRQLFKVDHFQHCHSALMGIVRFVTFVHMDLFTDKYFCSQKEKSTWKANKCSPTNTSGLQKEKSTWKKEN